MLKPARLAIALAVVSSLLSLPLTSGAIAREPDSPCYIRQRSGKVADLSYLCGEAPAGGRLPTVSIKNAECTQLRQILVQSSQEMAAISNQTTPQNGVQQISQLIGLNDRLSQQLGAMQMQDTALVKLRSRIVGYLKNLNTLAQRAATAAKSGSVESAEQTLQGLQGLVAQGSQIDAELNRYCNFK